MPRENHRASRSDAEREAQAAVIRERLRQRRAARGQSPYIEDPAVYAAWAEILRPWFDQWVKEQEAEAERERRNARRRVRDRARRRTSGRTG